MEAVQVSGRASPRRLLWWNPKPMDYRMELFRLIQLRHRVQFFFLAGTPGLELPNARFSRKGVMRASLLPRAMTAGDFLELLRLIRRSDVFVTSFILNAYTVVGAIAARLLDRPTVVWEELHWIPPTNRGRAKRWVLRLLARLPSAYFVLGTCQRNMLLSLGVKDERIFVANEYPGADFSSVPAVPFDLGLPETARVSLYLGRFVEFKGVDYLLRAFRSVEKRVPDAYLVLAGDGPLRRELEALSIELGLERVRFIGHVRELGQKSHLLQRASVLVVPSVLAVSGTEGGPLVVLEALSAGLPVIGTDALGSSTELIHPGRNGWIVPERNPQALAHALKAALTSHTITREDVRRSFLDLGDHDVQAAQLDRAIDYAVHGTVAPGGPSR